MSDYRYACLAQGGDDINEDGEAEGRETQDGGATEAKSKCSIAAQPKERETR